MKCFCQSVRCGVVGAVLMGLTLAAALPVWSQAPVADDAAYVNFSFDNVDVSTFVKLVGDQTGRKFVLSDGVTGKLTVVSPRVSRNEMYRLFLSILESSGYSVMQEGDIFRVVSLGARPALLGPVCGPDQAMPSSGVITRIFRLQHVSAAEIKKTLEPRVGGGAVGAVGAVEETNHLIVTDTVENLKRIERILQEIDRPGLVNVTEVVPLQFANADELAAQLNMAVSGSENRGELLRRRLPQVQEPNNSASSRTAMVIPSPHANSLIVVGTASQIEDMKKLIRQMDVDSTARRGRLNAIFLKYISAEDAAKSLNALLTKAAGGEKGAPAALSQRTMAIEPNKENNALLVDASPSDFDVVSKLIEQIDQLPSQVHIEVLIAEVSDSGSLTLGVELAAMDMPSKGGEMAAQGGMRLSEGTESVLDTVKNGIIPQGLSVRLVQGIQNADGTLSYGYPGIMRLEAIRKDSRFRIRSNPSLMAQDNKEASVSIVNQIPILKSTIQGGSGTSRDVIQNIERMDVGIKLKITPHVIPNGQVRMELNPSIEAVVDAGPSGQYTPTTARREVSTVVTVPDGETIVIAGLTREDKIKVVHKIPILGSIPLIGWLFRHTVDSTEKTNLLIFVTPRVMKNPAGALQLRQDLQKRTGLQFEDEPKK
jgi:general secretion pathway protein D